MAVLYIKFADENLRNFNHEQKQEQKIIKKKLSSGKNNHHEKEWTKVNNRAFYLFPHYYCNGEDKIIQGSEFAEEIKPDNVEKLSPSQFGKRLEKLTV